MIRVETKDVIDKWVTTVSVCSGATIIYDFISPCSLLPSFSTIPPSAGTHDTAISPKSQHHPSHQLLLAMFGRGFCGARCEYKFVHEYGRFRVEPGSLERIEGSKLKSMFVPKLTREEVRALDNRHFVASQLMHYGIEVDEKDFKGTCAAEESSPSGAMRPGP